MYQITNLTYQPAIQMNQIKIENIGTVQSVLKAVKCIEYKKCFIIVQIKSTFLTIQTRHF